MTESLDDGNWIFREEIEVNKFGPHSPAITYRLYHHKETEWIKKAQPYRDGVPHGKAEYTVALMYLDKFDDICARGEG